MEDFVPYDLAVKLKEKGFNEPCINAINRFKCTYRNGWLEYLDDREDEYITQKDLKNDGDCLLPLIHQVLKWLREEKKIFVIPSISPRINEEVKWDWDAGCFDNKKIFRWRDGNYGYNSYEQASLAGISWTLDNLI